MRTWNTGPGWENRAIRLNDEERRDPYVALADFFSCFHLQDARELLWDWLVAALSAENGAYTTGYARSNLIFVYEKLELLIEAAFVLHRKKRKRLKRKQRFAVNR